MDNNTTSPDSNRGHGDGGDSLHFLGVLFLMVSPFLLCLICIELCCKKSLQDTSPRHRPSSRGGASVHVVVVNEGRTAPAPALALADFPVNEGGLTAADLAAFPQYTYAQLKPLQVSAGCAVCLADYKDDDEALRLLPSCGHAFHRSCIDPWLAIHPTCPVCRSSPFEEEPVAPLANQ